ncbi:hypothetical protein D3C76_1608950 [compost metagenome]
MVVCGVIRDANRHLSGTEAVGEIILPLQLVIRVILRPLFERLDPCFRIEIRFRIVIAIKLPAALHQ